MKFFACTAAFALFHFSMCTGVLCAEPVAFLGKSAFQTAGTASEIAFSPDEKFVAAIDTGVPGATIRIFDVETGEQRQLLTDPDRFPASSQCLAYSPSGKEILCGTSSGEIVLRDVDTGEILYQRQPHKSNVVDVTYSPDGKWWASADSEGRIELRSVSDRGKTGRLLAIGKPRKDLGAFMTSAQDRVSSLNFSPDSSRLLVASPTEGGAVSVVDISNGKTVAGIQFAQSDIDNPSVTNVIPLPDGKTILTTGQITVPKANTSIQYGPKNVNLAQFKLWDQKTGVFLRDLHQPEQHGFGYASVSPDGTRILMSDFGLLSCRMIEDQKTLWETPLPGNWGHPPVYSPLGNFIALQTSSGFTLFNAQTGEELFKNNNKSTACTAANWSADGTLLVTGHSDGFVRVWNASRKELIWETELAPVIAPSGSAARPYFVGFLPEQPVIVVAGRRDDPVDYREGLVRAFNYESGMELFQRNFRRDARGAALSHDGKTVAVATNSGSLGGTHIYTIDSINGELLFAQPAEEVRAGFFSAEAIAFSRDDRQIHLATGDSEIVMLNASSGEEEQRVSIDWRTPLQRQLNKPKWAQLWEGSFTAAAETLITSSGEFLYRWDGMSGENMWRLPMPHLKGCKVTVSPDGTLLATSDLLYAGDRGEDVVRIYEVEKGNLLQTWNTPHARGRVLVFSPDNTRLFLGLTCGSAQILTLSDRK